MISRAMIVAIGGFILGGAIAVIGHIRATGDEPPAVVADEPAAATKPPAAKDDGPAPPHVDTAIVPADGEPLLHIVDPRLLAQWDDGRDGPLALRTMLTKAGGDADARWQTVARTLAADIARIVVELDVDWEIDIRRTYDPSAAKTVIGADARHRGNGNVARVLDARWLTADASRWLLAAVVFRPDRRDFVPGTCGELRLIYRLAYEIRDGEHTRASRMPVTVNAVWHVPDDGAQCRRVASRWRAPAIDDTNAEAIAAQLLAGPLALDQLRFAQLELDAQIVRFPSDLEHVDRRGFAGQALYWMRIFAARGDTWAPIGLENTPDVQAIRDDPELRVALLAWIADNFAAIDRGAFVLPEPLLADVALSWSTLGSARASNRPFAALLERGEAEAIVALSGATDRTFVTSGAALLERLDGASCSGCHQSSSTAGFHMLGIDRDFGRDPLATAKATDGNRLELPFSPHFAAEIPRRLRYLAQLERGTPTDPTRPHPTAPPARWDDGGAHYEPAVLGQPCLVDEAAIANASRWSCAEGLRCATVVHGTDAAFVTGQCLPDEPRAGASCLAATLERTPDAGARLAWNVRAFTDRVIAESPLFAIADRPLTTRSYDCRPSRIGVPLGRVTRNCRADEKTLAELADTSELCAIVGGKGFEAMATGAFDAAAFAAGVNRGMLDGCSAARPCREDYICQQLPDFLAAPRGPVAAPRLDELRARGLGFCTPTYFVYQLRLDGHPDPS